MPKLTWIGKDKIINHHRDVPFRVLQHQYGFANGETTTTHSNSGNHIIHGDNLEALKSLLPQYEAKIKCIYIDPPYNTGNENWVYNDNVNDPKIQKWLQNVVGKAGEDLSRHDKWLCMMYPRLQLLHQLLAHDGVIFISIDDNEQAHLRLVMDEIFGEHNFICQFVWKSRQNKDNRNINRVSNDHEYIICYGSALKGSERSNSNYSNPDNDARGDWTSANMVGLLDEKQRPNLHYDLIDFNTNINYGKPKMGWRYDKNTMRKLIEEQRILWPASPDGRPRRKVFLSELKDGVTGFSSITGEKIFTRDGTKAIQDIFNERVFEFSKPFELIQALVEQVTNKNDLILDSFAGSGTTAHAVLNLNQADGGNRKFILIEMEAYAQTITAERVKRVINGYGKTAGIAGAFDYYELGERLFGEDNLLNPKVEIGLIRNYIWYSETQKALNLNVQNVDNQYFLGQNDGIAYYFHYEPDKTTSLSHAFLETVRTPATHYVMYADKCTLNETQLEKYRITFKKIPRDITRF